MRKCRGEKCSELVLGRRTILDRDLRIEGPRKGVLVELGGRGVQIFADDDLADAGRRTLACRTASTAAHSSGNTELKRVQLDPALVVCGRHTALGVAKRHIDCHD